MGNKLGKKFWLALVIFSLMGQVAWVVENMYFNVFIYKMFHATAADISLMVSASAVVATVTTWLIGALSDYVGKRKIFVCMGYIIWGVTILGFSFIRMDILTPFAGGMVEAAALGVSLTIIMDCVMTFFGSTANDACFNAWLTDYGTATGKRGSIEGINSMMPLIAILVVFGGFMSFDLDKAASWETIYLIVGVAVIVIGLLGFAIIDEPKLLDNSGNRNYWKNVTYCFRPSVIKENKLLYGVVGAFAVFGISIQIFMPYLIIYYEQTLKMADYVLIMAPAIILAAVFTAFYGKLYDKAGFKVASYGPVVLLALGYILLFVGRATVPVFIGSFFMMAGYLSGMGVFGAAIRDRIPENKAGMFQGLRIVGQVLIPGILGPMIGAAVLKNAEVITNNDGTTSFLPNANIYLAALIVDVLLFFILQIIFNAIKNSHCDLQGVEKLSLWNNHPTPQFKRKNIMSLNGEWLLNSEKILVPYPPESSASGFKGANKQINGYNRLFDLPLEWDVANGSRVFLHFGAVDQTARVVVNGDKSFEHEGGYEPFAVEITDVVKAKDNRISVVVTDRLDKNLPYGKQCKNRGGMWYTPISGIWQSVWLEYVPKTYISDLKVTANSSDYVEFIVKVDDENELISKDERGIFVEINIDGEIHEYRMKKEENLYRLAVNLNSVIMSDGGLHKPKLWSVDEPNLYTFAVTCGEDRVESYFAVRSVEIKKIGEYNRVCLNGEPVILKGVLDQGYFCDGIYTPGDETEYEQDILRMKRLGFNTLRKHIKVEPEEFYYQCDRLGMLVIQDMVNNGKYSFIKDTALPTIGRTSKSDVGRVKNARQKENFVTFAKQTIDRLYNHPCVVVYTVFNEGWGQTDSDEIGDELRAADPTRLYDYTSGWFAQKNSDFDSRHIYFKDEEQKAADKALLISEFGGFSRKIEGHIFSKDNSYGYGICKDEKDLTDRIEESYEKMIYPSVANGLCGFVYTQLSDVEDEINGFYTYDRKVCKVDEARMCAINMKCEENM